MSRDHPILTLSVAASLLKIHSRTLMLYEKEGLISPHRTPTNRRLFSQADLSRIQFVKYLVETLGVNLKGVKAIKDIIAKLEAKNPNITKDLFPDFSEKKLI